MIQCCCCDLWFHQRCMKISKNDFKLFSGSCNFWICFECLYRLQPDPTSVIINNNLTLARIPCPFTPTRTFKDENRLQIHLQRHHKDQPLPSQYPSKNTISEILISCKSNSLTIRRIPKAARFQAADKLSKIINTCLSVKNTSAFEDLLTFSYKSFRLPPEKKSKSLTTIIKENLLHFSLPTNTIVKKKRQPFDIARKIEAKVGDFEIKGAVKLLSSDDTLAPFDTKTLCELEKKHPSPSRDLLFPEDPILEEQTLQIKENDVRRAINAFPAGSAAGLDGMRPQFLKDMISNSAGEAGTRVLTAITNLCNFLLSGQLPSELCATFYGAALCALNKKDGGLRPIAVGNCLRRLTAKLACSQVRSNLNKYFVPHQYGVSATQGCEVIIHKLRTFVNDQDNSQKILLKIDFRNAFNSVERDTILHEVQDHVPELYPFLFQCYRNPSELIFGNHRISSAVGAQQGDPCGPLAFGLAVHPIVKCMKSELNLWYLDDATLVGDPETVFSDFERLIIMAKEIGLEINPAKCEIFFVSCPQEKEIITKFETLAPSIKCVSEEDLTILGCPIFEHGFKTLVDKNVRRVHSLFDRAPNLNSHVAYMLVKNCLFVPKFTFLLRTAPFWKFPDLVDSLDSAMKSSLENILNIQLDSFQWTQASLPIRLGGLGIRRIRDISLPAFLASINGVHSLLSNHSLSQDTSSALFLQTEALDFWKRENGEWIPPVTHSQRVWDNIFLSRIISELPFNSEVDSARFRALSRPEAGAWLHAIPSKNIGTLMDNQVFQTCIALRLGCKIFENHSCECGAHVDAKGLHGLSCPWSKGRISRHGELNQIIQRTLGSIHIHASLEPHGLYRDDGKTPDGATLVPWTKGQRLVWDVTCVDTLAPSYLSLTTKEAGAAAEGACKRKHKKYEQLKSANFIFKGLAFETLGPWCQEAQSFLDLLGSILITETGDPKAKHYLMQRISLAIQRGNAASIRGTLPTIIPINEFHYL